MIEKISITVSLAFALWLILFILWLRRYLLKQSRHIGYQERKPMTTLSPVKIPFRTSNVKVKKDDVADKQLSITVEGNQAFVTKLYCYVGIEEVRKHYKLQQYKPDEKKKTLQELLDLLSMVTTDEQTVSFDSNYRQAIVTFSMKAFTTAEQNDINQLINQPQPKFIPYVVFMLLKNKDNAVNQENIVAMASVISCHKQNNRLVCEFVEHYIETVGEKVYPIKELYRSGVVNETLPSAPSLEADNSESFCIICQEHPITRAILPCRHTCLCKLCFQKVDDCPMCRQPIQSFFKVRQEDDLPETVDEQQRKVSDDLSNMGFWELVKSIWNAG